MQYVKKKKRLTLTENVGWIILGFQRRSCTTLDSYKLLFQRFFSFLRRVGSRLLSGFAHSETVGRFRGKDAAGGEMFLEGFVLWSSEATAASLHDFYSSCVF